MYRISTLNKISPKGLDLLPRDEFEVASDLNNPDAIIVRSAKMHDMEIPKTVRAIARAGAGTNNIPVEKCSEAGIVVFNTPGANANAVKELTLAGLFLASRKIYRGMKWVSELKGQEDINKMIEKEKGQFGGIEIAGKTLGIIGLGAIGVMVANDATALGMKVIGLDPYISVEAAWGLSRTVKRAKTLEELLSKSDYISIHVPLTDGTKGLINKEKLALAKPGLKVLNFSRGGIVNNKDILEAVASGLVSRYVTDFPEEELIGIENVLTLPHLGATTDEAEENCAVMAALQLKEFLYTGNIKNSVNFPDCELQFTGKRRLIIINKNIPNMVGQITTVLAENNINIADMINKHKNDYAYNIIDIDSEMNEALVDRLKAINGIVMARVLN